MEPKIVDLDRLILVGLPFYGEPSGGQFTQAWHRFFPLMEQVTHRVNPAIAYGVEIYGAEFFQDHKWTYYPSVAVSDLDEIPGILFAKLLPASRYAVFTAKGGVAQIHPIFQFAYGTWIPASEYEIAYPFDFELYGERFKGDDPDSEVDVYIPIKLKGK